MAIYDICYEIGIPCPRAGKKLTSTTRECNGWKDKNFVGCCALESPEMAAERFRNEKAMRQNYNKSGFGAVAMQAALKKAGLL